MSIDEATSTLIAGLYAGANDSRVWQRSVETVVERTGSRFAFVATLDPQRLEFPATANFGCNEGRFFDGIADYETRQYRHDPTAAHVSRNPDGRMVRSTDVIASGAYLEDPYVRWNIEALGSAFWQIHYTPPWYGLTLGLSLHRTADKGPFDDHDSRFIALIFDHMIAARQSAGRGVPLAAENGAALLIDRGGRIRDANDAGRAILARSDGLHAGNGNLRTSYGHEQPQLDAVLAAALDLSGTRAGGALLVSRPSARRPLVLRITPLVDPPSPFDRFRPAALVRIIDPDATPGAEAAHLWRTLYGLTPAETRLVETLLRGAAGLPEAAAELGVAYSTARTHLSAIFEKTGTRTQSQLARLATQLER